MSRPPRACGLAILAIALATLAGCATRNTHVDMVRKAAVDSVTVVWLRGDAALCEPGALGCALRTGVDRVGSHCTIVMPEQADDAVVAHEFKHCFGYEHAK